MLHCQAEGYPVPTVVWKRAMGRYLPEEIIFDYLSRFQHVSMSTGNELGEYKDFIYEPNLNLFENGSLKFIHVTKQSEGHYMCEAKNEIGSGVSKVIFLKVNSKFCGIIFFKN